MILEFQNVSGIGRGFCLKNISFQIPKGYLVGLAGKNGAGKTTLLHYIADGKKQYTGSIRFKGKELHDSHTLYRNQIAFVADEVSFFKKYSARQNAKLLAPFYMEWDWDIFLRATQEMEVFSGEKRKLDTPLANLSRGEYLCFQMAFAIAHHTRLYLLDEVTSGMDPVFRKEFFRLVSRILMPGDASVLMTTHIKEEMEEKMDYIGILEEGRLISFGEALDMFCEGKQDSSANLKP
ncbi:MAG: ABC transporter ATP-binding protein [Lachnospiraceae bacterium]|nr:ABC transporter ATP-binding protein [Lachnospiraceae bacterium]